jgi:hypothetical protein
MADNAVKGKKILRGLKELDEVKSRFVIPESNKPKIEDIIKEFAPEPVTEVDEIDELDGKIPEDEDFKEETQRIIERDQRTILILNKAIRHVREYDSKDTALELMNRAYRSCPSVFNRRMISNASASLKAAIKAEKWQKSRKKKRHVDEFTVQKNINTFYEKIADVVISVSQEIDKRNHRLFAKIKTEFVSELPLVIPESKSYIIRSAHIVAHCAHKPEGKHTHLERQLYLIEDATVVGINLQKIEKGESAIEKATTVALKHNAQLYEQVLLRPAQNVQWYLILNFGTKITFASFADMLQVDDGAPTDGTSYEDFLRQQEQQARVEEKFKTQRLRDFRQQFEEDNNILKEDYKILQAQLENLEDKKSVVGEHFSALTKLSEMDGGLTVSQASKLEHRMKLFRSNLMALEGVSSIEATEHSTRQRIEARSYLYEYKDIQVTIRALQQSIARNRYEWNDRRRQFALKLGLINPNSMIDNEFYTPDSKVK